MANFLVVVDPDTERRRRFIEAAEPWLAPVDGLSRDECATGHLCAIWAAAKLAPITCVADEHGAAVIWGEPLGGSGTQRMCASDLRRMCSGPMAERLPAFDGFYAAFSYDVLSGITTGADLLGLFPIYYYAEKDILLVGSSPELFRHHPLFQMVLDPAGLVGILLTMHSIGGRTLLRGVRRLSAGHALVWNGRTGARECRQYEPLVSSRYFDLPFAAHVDMLDSILDQTIARHVSTDQSYALLLSGGLDSRMVGGLLRRSGISQVKALTLGLATDCEMQCAGPVAQELGFEHHAVNVPLDQYPAYAHLEARWRHVSSGFNGIMDWGEYPHLRGLASRVISGYVVDPVVGGSHIDWAYSPLTRTMSFENFFARINGGGLPLSTVKNLLRRDTFGDLVDETVAGIRATYESYSPLESQRAWSFDLYHRQRFHSGGVAWAQSFGAWPVLLVLDRSLLTCVGGMPAATLANRRMQKEFICTRFPELAALPVDANSLNVSPLQPRLRWLLGQYLRNASSPVRRLARRSGRKLEENRYYYRLYDFNGPGWSAVRREAEPQRQRVLHLFNKEVLDTVLPLPEHPLRMTDPIVDASGPKSLLGFLLWWKDHAS